MNNNKRHSATELRRIYNPVVFFNEFAVGYEEPIECDPHRGYLSIFVTYDHTQDDDPIYEQEYYLSGDNDMILEMYEKAVTKQTEYVEKLIEE